MRVDDIRSKARGTPAPLESLRRSEMPYARNENASGQHRHQHHKIVPEFWYFVLYSHNTYLSIMNSQLPTLASHKRTDEEGDINRARSSRDEEKCVTGTCVNRAQQL